MAYKKQYPKITECLGCETSFTAEAYYDRFCSVDCRKIYKKEYQKHFKRQLRLLALEAYGSKCACCGETEEIFLTIDHIDGKGSEHRRKLYGRKDAPSFALYQWLKNNNYPEGFQLLCYNCNCAKRNGASCPAQHSRLNRMQEHDHNFLFKLASETGDIARYGRDLEAQIKKLKRRVERLEKQK